ncbi:threonine-phosphate decarboxylase CobD [uncultured Enterovirga sp.]|uniref:threonine-phosphate decarboxylase CobD n=1 Tax=uncultured Enterovirga sp. TaxID=2026352 RepID=UPI0035C9688F
MIHGGDLTEAMARHGAGDPPWLDLSTGINPHPWPVPEALARQGWERLPSAPDAESLLGAARAAYRVPDEAGIVAAPGTQALIQWLPRLAPPGGVAVLGPTYAEHEASWRLAGVDVHEITDVSAFVGQPGRGASFEAPLRGAPQDEEGRGIHSRPQAEVRAGPATWAGEPRSPHDARHLVVVHPNNPDGRLLSDGELLDAARLCQERGGWLIVDESFADIVPKRTSVALVAHYPVVVLRSFGKFYGLAGLRLGFAVAGQPIANAIRAALGPWAVSGPALAIGAAALADDGWAHGMRARLAGEAAALDRVLEAGRLEIVGGTSLYRLARHPEARALHEALAAEHIWVRRFTWAPDLLRFGLPPDEAGFDRLAAALRRYDQGTTTIRPPCSAR